MDEVQKKSSLVSVTRLEELVEGLISDSDMTDHLKNAFRHQAEVMLKNIVRGLEDNWNG